VRIAVNNRQVCHLWANQSQSHARGPSIFFNDSRIYSYGHHYLMGMIHKVKHGNKIALINSRGYSVTTAKHTSYAWSALHGNVAGFSCSNPEDLKLAVKEQDIAIKTQIESSLRRMKVTDKDSITWELRNIREALNKANNLRAYLGRAKIKVKESDLAKVRAHLEKRLARYGELNTPAMIAARNAEAIQRDLIEAEKRRLELSLQIERFRIGEVSYVPGLKFEILRVRNGVIQTSAGAEVPLEDGKRLFKLIQANPDAELKGYRVGGFNLESIVQTDTDKVIKIGCHHILFSEAYRALGGVA
jgi:hypothetical protein